jgi:hypothetical protein
LDDESLLSILRVAKSQTTMARLFAEGSWQQNSLSIVPNESKRLSICSYWRLFAILECRTLVAPAPRFEKFGE